MSKNTRVIILSVLAVLIVIVLSIGITTAFMKPVEQGGNLTEISLSSCAKIKLTGTSSVNLSNSYPMSRNKGLQTTPYSFTVTSYCDTYVGFSLYIATLSTNTLDASNIHYILTNKDSKEAIVEGNLASAENGENDFNTVEKTELNTGLKGTYGNIYKIFNDDLLLKGEAEYDLYLYVEESASNTTMGKTFSAGVSVKSYDRELLYHENCDDDTLTCHVAKLYTGIEGENSVYYHNSKLANGAGDNSYRYAGASDDVNNFVCFGSNTSPCPKNNLYRIIGVFYESGSGQYRYLVKLIKADYASSDILGTDGNFVKNNSVGTAESSYKGSLLTYDTYNWKTDNDYTDKWTSSLLYKTNLNTNFISHLGENWSNKIQPVAWKIGDCTNENVRDTIPSWTYVNEVANSSNASTDLTKIGLMYISDYGFAASPDAWELTMYNYDNAIATDSNWMYMGLNEWTISKYGIQLHGGIRLRNGSLVNSIMLRLSLAVRPTFYLNPDVVYKSGSGTANDPIIIN